jgi:hypothetical protein
MSASRTERALNRAGQSRAAPEKAILNQFMKLFQRTDDEFIGMGADSARRPAAIQNLTWRRALMFWCAVVCTLSAFVCFFVAGSGSHGEGPAAFVACVMWIQVMKLESDLRLLKMVEALRK